MNSKYTVKEKAFLQGRTLIEAENLNDHDLEKEVNRHKILYLDSKKGSLQKCSSSTDR